MNIEKMNIEKIKNFLISDYAIFIIAVACTQWYFFIAVLCVILSKRRKKRLAISDMENQLQEVIVAKENEFNALDVEISKKNAVIYDLNSQIKEIDNIYTSIIVDTSLLETLDSQELKNELSKYKMDESEIIKKNNAIKTLAKGKRKSNDLKQQSRQLLRSFNAECDLAISSVNLKNIDTMRNKIIKAYETLNKLFEIDSVQIKKEYLEIKLQQLIAVYIYQEKLEDERILKKEIQEQLKEEEKVRREIERQKLKIEKDEMQFKNEISKLMKYIQKTNNDIEKNLYIDKIKELEGKLSELENVKADVLNRELNTRAGFVYIISNIGSFGENIFKIGMTRRLEPMDRIKELSSASVPFEFDVHAMIFSDDAPALESILHNTFRDYEVNKINHRKEFFNIPIQEIEKIVTKHHNAAVKWNFDAVAEEYRKSINVYQ